MSILIVKLNATGDVVRTTTLLRKLTDDVTWITAAPNNEFLSSGLSHVRCVLWEDRQYVLDRHYELIVNLEDEAPVADFVANVPHNRLFGAYRAKDGSLAYSEDSRDWFDLSLISVHGRQRADELKLRNRRTYQDLIFQGLGLTFAGETYVLPPPLPTGLSGDVAIAPLAGPIWPMKAWAHYDLLRSELERAGLCVNVLPRRNSLLEHMGDIYNHRCLVSGDSLPMHLALGTGTPCVTLFSCTSPWEIHEYGIQTKLISPLLERFFYKRDFHAEATTAIPLESVYTSVIETLQRPLARIPRASQTTLA